MDAKEKQEIETRQYRAEIRRAIAEVARNQDCLHKGFLAYKDEDEAWKARFEPFLVEEIQSKEDRQKFIKERKRAIAARVFDSLVYGGFIAAAYTLWNYRDAIKAIKDLS
jgi:hypothetical protein